MATRLSSSASISASVLAGIKPVARRAASRLACACGDVAKGWMIVFVCLRPFAGSGGGAAALGRGSSGDEFERKRAEKRNRGLLFLRDMALSRGRVYGC